jgi:hypothetical protein
MAANTDITAVFYAQNNSGSNFNNANISSVSMTVIDGAGTTRTTGNLADGFIGDFKLITSGTGYKLQTAVNTFWYSAAGYESNKDPKETYTFNFTWTTSAGDTSSTSATGSLTNLVPEFTVGASLPDVTVSAAATSVVTRGGNNGSATSNTSGLAYSITAGNTGSYFSINSTTGAITKSTSTPIGVYNLTLKLEDAISGGVAQTNSLNITKTQKITVGADAVNAGVISNCYWTRTPNLAGTNQITAPYDATTVTGAWYLSDSTLTASDLPVTPSANTSESNFLHKLGSALSQGTVVFSCNMQQKFSDNDGGLLAWTASSLIWKIWYRDPSGLNTWNQIDDVNNDNMGVMGDSAALQSSSFTNNAFTQAVFAFDQVGEYCIAALTATTTTANIAADAMCAWINSNDLYYSTCVVENGYDVTDGGTPKRYEYNLSAIQTAYACVPVATSKYVPHPYANYVTEFYNDANLTTPFTPLNDEYYTFTTDPTEPFDSIKVSAKFNTSGIKISPDLGMVDTCNDMYARACQSAVITCTHPIIGGVGW